MLPHSGQGANQAIEDAVSLAEVMCGCDRSSAPHALQVYETLRRDRCARIQKSSRVNGARYDAEGYLADRDRMLALQAQERAWVWDYDAELEASRVAYTQ